MNFCVFVDILFFPVTRRRRPTVVYRESRGTLPLCRWGWARARSRTRRRGRFQYWNSGVGSISRGRHGGIMTRRRYRILISPPFVQELGRSFVGTTVTLAKTVEDQDSCGGNTYECLTCNLIQVN